MTQPSDEELTLAKSIFKVLGNEKRIRLLLLLEGQPLNVSEISHRLSLPQPTVSHQLALLKESQLVRSHRHGKQIYYHLDDPHIVEVVNDVLAHTSHVLRHRDHWNNQI